MILPDGNGFKVAANIPVISQYSASRPFVLGRILVDQDVRIYVEEMHAVFNHESNHVISNRFT